MVNTDVTPMRTLSPIICYPEEDAEFTDDDNFSDEDSGNQEWRARDDCVHVGVYSENIPITEESKVAFEEVHPGMVPFVRSPGLSECTSRWNGLRDTYMLENFLLNVSYYKAIYHISDQEAIGDLHFLFESQARTWWQNILIKPRSWTEVVVLMRRTFGVYTNL